MTDEEKSIMEEWTVTQEEAEAEIYANEKHCKKCINFADCEESAIEDRCKAYRESYKDYLNGLTEGKPKWHDLRKNPNDLPEAMGFGSREVYISYADGVTDIACYRFDNGYWQRSEDDEFVDEVIAWCELPKFKE